MRRIFLSILALGIGTAVALVLAEVVLRAFELAPSSGIASVNEKEFEQVPGIFKPNQQLIDRQRPALPFEVRINDLGYRGQDFPRAKPKDEFRILMIGDSFTYGDFVDDDETLPAQVEAALRKRCGFVRVINAGVGGSTIITQTRLAKRALPLEPDLVVLTFSENDLDDLARPLWFDLETNRQTKSRFPMSVLYPVMRHTALWNFALKQLATVRAQRRAARLRANGEPSPEQPEEAERWHREGEQQRRDTYRRALAELKAALRARDVPLLYAIFPGHYSVMGDLIGDRLHWVESTSRELGIPTANFLGQLRATGLSSEELYLVPRDGHPSPTGYRSAAGYLVEVLLEYGLAPPACGAGG